MLTLRNISKRMFERKPPIISERATTVTKLDGPIFLKNCFKRKILEISTAVSSRCIVN